MEFVVCYRTWLKRRNPRGSSHEIWTKSVRWLKRTKMQADGDADMNALFICVYANMRKAQKKYHYFCNLQNFSKRGFSFRCFESESRLQEPKKEQLRHLL